MVVLPALKITAGLYPKLVFHAMVVTYLYGHYRQKGGNGHSKAYELLYPYALSLFIEIIELISQNGSNIDFIDNIYHALFARMLRMTAYDYAV